MNLIKKIIIENFSSRNLLKIISLKDKLYLMTFVVLDALKINSYYKYKYLPKIINKKDKFLELTNPYACYIENGNTEKPINLYWSDGPKSGNYGDWLSPYLFQKLTSRPIFYYSSNFRRDKNIIGIGSVVSVADNYSHIFGSGINNKDDFLNINAKYFFVRGRYTDSRLEELGGKKIKKYGDMGFILPEVYSGKRLANSKKIYLVRHINEEYVKINLPLNIHEIKINANLPSQLENFIDCIINAELVITSAMHCYITCLAYNIPSLLINISSEIPGDGIKYLDMLSGVNLREEQPIIINSTVDIYKQLTPFLDRIQYLERGEVERIYELTTEAMKEYRC